MSGHESSFGEGDKVVVRRGAGGPVITPMGGGEGNPNNPGVSGGISEPETPLLPQSDIPQSEMVQTVPPNETRVSGENQEEDENKGPVAISIGEKFSYTSSRGITIATYEGLATDFTREDDPKEILMIQYKTETGDSPTRKSYNNFLADASRDMRDGANNPATFGVSHTSVEGTRDYGYKIEDVQRDADHRITHVIISKQVQKIDDNGLETVKHVVPRVDFFRLNAAPEREDKGK